MARNILMLVVFVVGGLCFGVIYLAEYDTYERTRDGEQYSGPILEIKKAGIAFQDQASGERRFLRDPPEDWKAQRQVGEVIRMGCSVVRCEALDIIAPPSPLLFVPMGGLILIGILFVVLPIRDRKRLAMAGTDPLAVVTALLKKSRFLSVVVALLFTAFAGFFVLVMVADPQGTVAMVFIGVLAACSLGVAGFFFRKFIALLDVNNSWIVHIITQRPEQIVWVWERLVTSKTNLAESSTVVINMVDGREFSVLLGQGGAQEFITAVATRAPHAMVGYSPELAKAYKQDPASLGAGR